MNCKHKFVYWKCIDNPFNPLFKGKDGDVNLIFFCEKCLKVKVKNKNLKGGKNKWKREKLT
jgi:hypothetical protein